MTAKELRIGNLVYCKTENGIKVGKISSLTDFGFIEVKIGNVEYGGKVEYNVIEPIPITEDVLLNNGFKKRNDGDCHTIYTYDDGFEILCEMNVYYPYSYHFDFTLGKELKYIHELQNAVFVLTGDEIDIKL